MFCKRTFVLLAALCLAGCQTVNTTQSGAVGVQRTQFMMSGLSSNQLDQEYANSYREMQNKAAMAGALDKSSALFRRVQMSRIVLSHKQQCFDLMPEVGRGKPV